MATTSVLVGDASRSEGLNGKRMTSDNNKVVVKQLQSKIAESAAILTNANAIGAPLSEADTERLIIQPLLLALGYNALDFFQRTRDSGSMTFPDYTLLSGVHRWVLEAKALDQRLGPKETLQVLGYASSLNCKHAVLTNGRRWKVYHFPCPEAILDILDIFTDQQGASQLIMLAKQSMMHDSIDNPISNEQPLNRSFLMAADAPSANSVRSTPQPRSSVVSPVTATAPVLYPLTHIAAE